MADKSTLAPPRGMRDFYPEDMRLRNRLFDTWRAAAQAAGFQPYDACVVESLELLTRKAGEEIVEQIYAFKDKSDRDLALRPEMTPTLARMVAARQSALEMPLKWYTVAQCFRYERMTRGRKREHYQWNLDIIGSDDVAAEVEVIGTAVEALRRLGLGPDDVGVRVNSRAVLADILDAQGIPPAHHGAVFLALDKRGKQPDEQIAELLAAEGIPAGLAATIMDLAGIASLDDALARLDPAAPSAAALRRFFALADDAGLTPWLQYDIGVIRGLAYYTGIVFEAFDRAGRFRAIFGGGRYDNLLATVGGKPCTGVGLGFGDVVIGELLAEARAAGEAAAREGVAVGFMAPEQQAAAVRLAARLRQAGECVDLALAPEKPRNFFARADRRRFAEAVYLGPDDVQAGCARRKQLETRTESACPL